MRRLAGLIPALLGGAGLLVAAAAEPEVLFPEGKAPAPELGEELRPLIADWQLVYVYDPFTGLTPNQAAVRYERDDSAKIEKFSKVGYLLYLEPQEGTPCYVWATMDAFTEQAKQLGVPTKASGAVFQQKVKNLEVRSNRPEVASGSFKEGALEFWPQNYYPYNARQYPGGDHDRYDFGDQRRDQPNPGYGSMQLHNLDRRSTVFAFNKWRDGRESDLGIGNNPDPNGNPDWTDTGAARNYRFARLLVLVR